MGRWDGLQKFIHEKCPHPDDPPRSMWKFMYVSQNRYQQGASNDLLNVLAFVSQNCYQQGASNDLSDV